MASWSWLWFRFSSGPHTEWLHLWPEFLCNMAAPQLLGGLSLFEPAVAPNQFMLGKICPKARCGFISGSVITTWDDSRLFDQSAGRTRFYSSPNKGVVACLPPKKSQSGRNWIFKGDVSAKCSIGLVLVLPLSSSLPSPSLPPSLLSVFSFLLSRCRATPPATFLPQTRHSRHFHRSEAPAESSDSGSDSF